jgi:hypothetical protein
VVQALSGGGLGDRAHRTVRRLKTTDHAAGAAVSAVGGAGGVSMGGVGRGHTVASARVPAVVDR